MAAARNALTDPLLDNEDEETSLDVVVDIAAEENNHELASPELLQAITENYSELRQVLTNKSLLKWLGLFITLGGMVWVGDNMHKISNHTLSLDGDWKQKANIIGSFAFTASPFFIFIFKTICKHCGCGCESMPTFPDQEEESLLDRRAQLNDALLQIENKFTPEENMHLPGNHRSFGGVAERSQRVIEYVNYQSRYQNNEALYKNGLLAILTQHLPNGVKDIVAEYSEPSLPEYNELIFKGQRM